VLLKILGFSWSWLFVVRRKRRCQPILGADFISKNKKMLLLGPFRRYFTLAASVFFRFIQCNYDTFCSQYMSLSSLLPHIQSGKLSPSQRGELELLITQYPNVLTEKLSVTHLVEYEIQLLETTAVRLAPYRLAPSKMQYLCTAELLFLLTMTKYSAGQYIGTEWRVTE